MLIEELPSSKQATELLHAVVMREPFKAARRVDKPLALYGAGKLGRMAIELLERIGITEFVVVDQGAERIRSDPFWHGRNLVRPDELPASVISESLLAVCIATESFERLALELTAQGWKDIVPFYDVAEAYTDSYPLGNGWELNSFDEEEVEATSEVLTRWGDDISRAHHLQFIAWHRLREDWIFSGAQVDQDNRYFIPQVLNALGESSALLDVGAHHGEICQRYIRETSGRFHSAWMLEPDIANANVIRYWLNRLDDGVREKIALLECAALDHSGTKPFFGGIGYASQISSLGGSLVPVLTIDELCLTPTFVKLHLEGAELSALKGAKDTLRCCLPVVAVTTYHNRLGVWETPLWLMHFLADLDAGYRFFFRLHSWCGTGAVLYAIPGMSK